MKKAYNSIWLEYQLDKLKAKGSSPFKLNTTTEYGVIGFTLVLGIKGCKFKSCYSDFKRD